MGDTVFNMTVFQMVTAAARDPHLTLLLSVAALHVSTAHEVCLLLMFERRRVLIL
jgi:hypothetical protein